MVFSINRYDACKCGSLKDRRAKQCTKCRQKIWEASRLKKRKVKCICGNMMDHRAKKCVTCFKQEGMRRRQLRRICECGNVKSEKSVLCLNCQLKKVNPIVDGCVLCTACNVRKPLDQFYMSCNKSKPRPWCIKCTSELARNRHIFKKCRDLGIDDHKTFDIVRLKSVECAICKNVVTKFHIDHCHSTNKFRGLLCSNCNTGMGLFRDNPQNLLSAVKYLENFSKQGEFNWCFQ